MQQGIQTQRRLRLRAGVCLAGVLATCAAGDAQIGFVRSGSTPDVRPPESRSQRRPAPRRPPGQGDAPQWVLPAVDTPRLRNHIFQSAAARSKVSYHIYIPDAYDTQTKRRFPVLYWLHGSGGGAAELRPLAKYFGDAIRDGKIPPMLIVFPNGLRNGMWCDSKDGRTPIETILMKELIPDVDATFRTIASRAGRIIEGFSMGGYGAARLGFKYPDIFCAVSILGGGPLQKDFKKTPRATPRAREWLLRAIYGGDHAYFRAQSPWVLTEQHAASLRHGILIRQSVGELDETLPANRELHEHLRRLKIPHTFTVLPGVEHNPRALFRAMGQSNWEFYRLVFGGKHKNQDRESGIGDQAPRPNN
ncbi:MAG: alpha/beta hydrolase [Phycisphaerae bacterium]